MYRYAYDLEEMVSNRMPQIILNTTTIELVHGDITQQHTDAIVNAANSSLLGGGGVDGAIHRAAGPELLKETRELGGCKTGDAKISKGYKLPARYVIHAVGPIYQYGNDYVETMLASAYHRSMEIATEHHLESIAFPAISTGIYGYPLEEAAPIALSTVCNFIADHSAGSIKLVRFVLYTDAAFAEFAAALRDCARAYAIDYTD